LKAKYPDREFADDEALFGQINDDYDGYDKELSGYKEREKALSGYFAFNRSVYRSRLLLTSVLLGIIQKFNL
jgi:hypothetical protein